MLFNTSMDSITTLLAALNFLHVSGQYLAHYGHLVALMSLME